MTGPLTHTAPVPLPVMQEPGPVSADQAVTSTAQQAPADTSASAYGSGTHQETTHALPGTENSARRVTPRTVVPTNTATAQGTDSLPADTIPAQDTDSLTADTLCTGPLTGDSLLFFFLGRPAAGHGRHTLARRAGRRGFRSGIDPRSGPRPAGGPGSVPHRKPRFSGLRSAARGNLCHTALPQSGRHTAAADAHIARHRHGRTPYGRSGRQRFLALPEHRNRDRHSVRGRHDRQVRRFADPGQPDRDDPAGRRAGPQPAGDVRLPVRGAFPAGESYGWPEP